MFHRAVIIGLTVASVGTCGIWLASHFTTVEGFWEFSDTWSFTYDIRTGHAHCFVTHYRAEPKQQALFVGRGPLLSWCGLGAYSYDQRGFLHSGLLFPLWGLLALLAAYPIVAFCRGPLRRRHRREKGLCVRCGYNLEGNVSGICPECGEKM